MKIFKALFKRDDAFITFAAVFWLISLFFSNALALLIGFMSFIWYGKYIESFAQKVMSNEYPYNLIVKFVFVVFGTCILISRMVTNQLISAVTGFNPSLFSNSNIVLTAILTLIVCSWCFCLYGLLTLISRGYAVHVSVKMGVSAVMVGLPLALVTYDITINKNGGIIKFSESAILISDFIPNASLRGVHFNSPGTKRYTIKTCQALPDDYWTSPLASGGYIVAIPRKGYEAESSVLSIEERPTGHIFKTIGRNECPENGRYSEN